MVPDTAAGVVDALELWEKDRAVTREYLDMRLARMESWNEFNIGHSMVCRSLFVGLEAAVREMLQLLAPP
jgi:hypothetical protein